MQDEETPYCPNCGAKMGGGYQTSKPDTDNLQKTLKDVNSQLGTIDRK